MTLVTQEVSDQIPSYIALAFKKHPAAMAVTDASGTVLAVNQKFTEVTGYREGAIKGQNMNVLKSGRQSKKFYREFWDSIQRQGVWKGQIWNKDSKGREYLEHLCVTELSIAGFKGYMAEFYDSQIEQERDQIARLSSSIFRYNPEGIVVTDSAFRIIEVNTAFTEITGYSEDEVVGRNPNLLSSGMQDDNFYKDMWSEINENHTWSGELWNKKKDNELYFQKATISAIHNDEGFVSNYIGIFSDITEIRNTQRQVEQLAYYDTLTGLPNRSHVKDELSKSLRKAKRCDTQVAVIYADMDGFKQINDQYGHHMGDNFLKAASVRMKECLRVGDTAARLGGDEFIFVINDITSQDDIDCVTARLINAATRKVCIQGHQLQVTLSIGVALFPNDARDPETLVGYADMAMYESKKAGKNRVTNFEADMATKNNEKVSLKNSIENALINNELEIFYQPIVEPANKKVKAIEALVRWDHPANGIIEPAEFLPSIDDISLITQLGEEVLKKVVSDLELWRAKGHVLQANVNIHPKQLMTDQFIEFLKDLLYKSGISSKQLGIEVLETTDLFNASTAITQIDKLRDMGVLVTLDDFGTGTSSLSYIQSMPIDILKVDQFFIRDIVDSPRNVAIAKGIVNMAEYLGIPVVAEGVETKEHFDCVKEIGADYIQGFHIARPMTSTAFIDWLDKKLEEGWLRSGFQPSKELDT
ncbi:EAL domain-containing protein [Neptuniibacter sp. QD37_11]|uniref:EAL domain-containing protein n=1 Tax=Neptuniibacter sp. QD37_11 TaxID=3398209 RepID=UPI0039F5AA4F